MILSHATPEFLKAFHELPKPIQDSAREAFELFRTDPRHPSLYFKKIDDAIYSVRVTLKYRALGSLENGEIVWFWIGGHAEYDRRI